MLNTAEEHVLYTREMSDRGTRSATPAATMPP